MRRVLSVALLLGLTAAAAVVYHAASRDHDYRTHIARGDTALREDQTYVALEAYSGAVALRPDSMLAHLRRGETYQRRGELDEAARDFRAAAQLDPAATRPLEELGDVLYQRQRYQLASETYERCLRVDDRSPRVSYKLALSRYREGRLDQALAAVVQTIRLNDRLADAHYLRGLCLRDRRQFVLAAAAFEKAVALSPALIPAREELIDLYEAAGRKADEMEQLQVIAGLDRDHVERQVAVAAAQARAGHTDVAILTLVNALERTPDQPSVYAALGRLWLDIAQSRTDHPEALGKALESLARAAAASSASSDTLTLYGRALILDGRLDAAADVLRQATTRFPVEPAAFLYYATVAEKRADAEGARASLIRHAALVPDDPEVVTHAMRIATLSLRLDDVATAIEWLKKTASASANDVKVLATLADAQIRYGDYEAAAHTIKIGLDKDPTNASLEAARRRIAMARP